MFQRFNGPGQGTRFMVLAVEIPLCCSQQFTVITGVEAHGVFTGQLAG